MTTPRIHPSLQLAWALANREAHFSGSPTIEPLHFLVAILLIIDDCFLRDAEAMGLSSDAIEEIANLSAKARKTIGIPQERITGMRRELAKSLRQPDQMPEPSVLHRSDESRALFQDAADQAKGHGDEAINMLHLLEALFRRMPIDRQAASADRLGTLIQELRAQVPPPTAGLRQTRSGMVKTPLLNDLGRDLTALARGGRLPPVVGRKKEMTAVARHLQRTTKRNVLIIGEAGAGKTAIVEGFAQKIAGKEVPEFLMNLRIVQVNVSDLVAGTHYRGDMESRVKRMIEEASADPNLVLFLDEIHLAVKAGTGGGAPMDIAGMLKPALSRDDFRCIGATTVDEFERHIKGDAALLRRFQIVRIAEPTKEDALVVCTAWAHRVEHLQGVQFAEDAVASAVELSVEFVRGRSLPDKAIDLLENAAVLVKVSSLSGRPVTPSKTPPTVTRAHVVAVIEEQYGISVRQSDLLDARKIGVALRQEIVGQDNAIEELTREIESLGNGTGARLGPLGVFMFTGPTGTGKTFAGERLGRLLFPDAPNAVTRFNMNEFKERHEIARLIGAPPGFVGHDQAGAIFRFAEVNPQGLIILDEMEKAHPEIQDYFLQIFDKGEAQDSRGRKVDFRPYVFVVTCNLTAQQAARPRIGFAAEDATQPEATRQGSHSALSQRFRPEFLARIRRVVEFQEIGRKDYLILLERRFTALAERMRQEHNAAIQLTDKARSQFADFCTTQGDGCRGFDRLFDRLISSPITNHVKDQPQPTPIVLQEFSDATPVLRTT